ncbi:hypothetical protein C8J56DRAFT_1045113 [Mycena floridula]|nr:hypothetical protein C8J56DRAFT_1045113 [Mycena floridula]
MTTLHASRPKFLHSVCNERKLFEVCLKHAENCENFICQYFGVLWTPCYIKPMNKDSPPRLKPQPVLIRKTRCLLKAPGIAPLVRLASISPNFRNMTVSFEECSTDNWQPLAQLIQCLRFLPNIEKVHIAYFPPQLHGLLRAARRPLARSCHELRSDTAVKVRGKYGESRLCDSQLFMVLKGCKHVKRVANFSPTEAVMTILAAMTPELEIIEFDEPEISPSLLANLRSLEHLHSIELRAASEIHQPIKPTEEESIQAARTLLRDSPSTREK